MSHASNLSARSRRAQGARDPAEMQERFRAFAVTFPADAPSPAACEAVPAELERAVRGSPALRPEDVPALWRAVQIRLEPLGRLAPVFPIALTELAVGIVRFWRPSDRDLARLDALWPGNAAGAALALAVGLLAATAPGPVPLMPPRRPRPYAHRRYGALWLAVGGAERSVAYDYLRRLVAAVLRTLRRMIRGPHPPGAERVLQAMDENRRMLRLPLGERLAEQWRRACRPGTLVLEVQDLLLALWAVAPPGPGQEVGTMYSRALEGLVDAAARLWRVRPADRARLRAAAAAEGQPPDQLKREVLKLALLDALAERQVPQVLRGPHGRHLDGGRLVAPALGMPGYRFAGWLLRETQRRARAELRKLWPPARRAESGYRPAVEADPLEALVAQERLRALEAALRDDTDRRLLEGVLADRPLPELARDLGISHAAAKKRMERIRVRARRATDG